MREWVICNGVDGEVSPRQVIQEGYAELHHSMPAVGANVFAKAGHLVEVVATIEHGDGAVFDPHRHGARESRRTSCGGAAVVRSKSLFLRPEANCPEWHRRRTTFRSPHLPASARCPGLPVESAGVRERHARNVDFGLRNCSRVRIPHSGPRIRLTPPSDLELPFHECDDHVLDGEVQLLDVRGFA